MGLAETGYDSTLDITACPGTDTCNLGISSSTGITVELEKVLRNEFPQYANNKEITIKISGCMNSCGQHTMAHIGFQGMSIKSGNLVAPALQMAPAVAKKVNGVVITSSPLPISNDLSARNSASVPEETPIACFVLQ